jgi:hypothetical protein
MSTSTDFQLTALSKEDIEYFDRQRASGYCLCAMSRPWSTCLEPVRFEFSYSYISGKKGRRSFARLRICANHARAKATKLNLEMPAAVEP